MERSTTRGSVSLEDLMNVDASDEQLQMYAGKYSDAILLVPRAVQKAMLLTDKGCMDATEEELTKWYRPKEKVLNLRAAFWDEYHHALKEDRLMEMHNVYSKICTQNFFFNIAMKSASYMVWIFRPTKNYNLDREATLRKGLERLKEILELPIMDPDTGKVNTATAGLIIRTVKMIEDRVAGAVVNRHEHLNVHAKLEKALPKDIAELEAKIQALEVQVVTGAKVPEVLPVEFSPQRGK